MSEKRIGPYVKIDGKWRRDWDWKAQWVNFASEVESEVLRQDRENRRRSADAWIDAHVTFHPAVLGPPSTMATLKDLTMKDLTF